MYFQDFYPYEYDNQEHPGRIHLAWLGEQHPSSVFRGNEGMVHIGWLGGGNPFPTGSVDPMVLERLKVLAQNPAVLHRGSHLCDLCTEPEGLITMTLPNSICLDPSCSWAQWSLGRLGNGEIRVGSEQVTFAAPVLIVHYIEEHSYLPPMQFQRAVLEGLNTSWNRSA